MRFRRNKKSKLSSCIDITQLVNLVFLLLVFLLLAMGVPLGLDGTHSIPRKEYPSEASMKLVVLPQNILIDGKNAKDQALGRLPRNRDIVILASKDIPYSRIAGVLDTLKESGHTRISLATKPSAH